MAGRATCLVSMASVSQPSARNVEYTMAMAGPLPSTALAVNTANSARTHIWVKTMMRVRPSSRP